MSRRCNGEGSIYKCKRTGKHVAQYQIGVDEHGKRKFKTASADTQAEALVKLEQLRKQYGTISFYEKSKSQTQEVIKEWFDLKTDPSVYDRTVKANTIDRIESVMNTHIIPAIGNIPLCEVSYNDVQKIIDGMSDKGLSYSTAKKVYDYCSAFFNFCLDEEYVSKSPMRKVRLRKSAFPEPKKISSISDEQAALLVLAATVKYGNGRLIYDTGYAIPVMLETGLRTGEVLGLRWSRVHLDCECPYLEVVEAATEVRDRVADGQIRLKLDTPKSRSSKRVVPLNSNAVRWLKCQKSYRYYGENTFVFNVDKDVEMPVKPSHLRRAFDKMQERAGITPKIRLHQLRHTFATRANKKVKDPLVVARLLGHSGVQCGGMSDLSTTLGYIDVTNEQLREAIEAISDNKKEENS